MPQPVIRESFLTDETEEFMGPAKASSAGRDSRDSYYDRQLEQLCIVAQASRSCCDGPLTSDSLRAM